LKPILSEAIEDPLKFVLQNKYIPLLYLIDPNDPPDQTNEQIVQMIKIIQPKTTLSSLLVGIQGDSYESIHEVVYTINEPLEKLFKDQEEMQHYKNYAALIKQVYETFKNTFSHSFFKTIHFKKFIDLINKAAEKPNQYTILKILSESPLNSKNLESVIKKLSKHLKDQKAFNKVTLQDLLNCIGVTDNGKIKKFFNDVNSVAIDGLSIKTGLNLLSSTISLLYDVVFSVIKIVIPPFYSITHMVDFKDGFRGNPHFEKILADISKDIDTGLNSFQTVYVPLLKALDGESFDEDSYSEFLNILRNVKSDIDNGITNGFKPFDLLIRYACDDEEERFVDECKEDMNILFLPILSAVTDHATHKDNIIKFSEKIINILSGYPIANMLIAFSNAIGYISIPSNDATKVKSEIIKIVSDFYSFDEDYEDCEGPEEFDSLLDGIIKDTTGYADKDLNRVTQLLITKPFAQVLDGIDDYGFCSDKVDKGWITGEFSDFLSAGEYGVRNELKSINVHFDTQDFESLFDADEWSKPFKTGLIPSYLGFKGKEFETFINNAKNSLKSIKNVLEQFSKNKQYRLILTYVYQSLINELDSFNTKDSSIVFMFGKKHQKEWKESIKNIKSVIQSTNGNLLDLLKSLPTYYFNIETLINEFENFNSENALINDYFNVYTKNHETHKNVEGQLILDFPFLVPFIQERVSKLGEFVSGLPGKKVNDFWVGLLGESFTKDLIKYVFPISEIFYQGNSTLNGFPILSWFGIVPKNMEELATTFGNGFSSDSLSIKDLNTGLKGNQPLQGWEITLIVVSCLVFVVLVVVGIIVFRKKSKKSETNSDSISATLM